MNDCTPKSRVVLAKMNEPVIKQSMDETRNDVVVLDTPQDITHEMTNTQEPYRSRRIIRLPVRFIGPRETYKAISEEAETYPYTYEKAMNGIESQMHIIGVKTMKYELDSMYSNQVWDLVKVSNGIKPLVTRGREGQMERLKPLKHGQW